MSWGRSLFKLVLKDHGTTRMARIKLAAVIERILFLWPAKEDYEHRIVH